MYQTTAENTASNAEKTASTNPTIAVGVSDNIEPLPRKWIKLELSKYLTFTSNVPVSIEGYSFEVTTT